MDGALAQLNQSLAYDPKHAGTLMNIGIIRWRGKNDVDGAVAAWEKLLQYHPDFPQKDLVQQMITQAKQTRRRLTRDKKDNRAANRSRRSMDAEVSIGFGLPRRKGASFTGRTPEDGQGWIQRV